MRFPLDQGPRVVSIIEALQIDIRDVAKGNYVACMYDKKVWYGIVNDISEEFGDLLIKFMHPSGPMNKFVIPEVDDTCWIEESDILCTIDPPSLTSSRGYTLSCESLKSTIKCGPPDIYLFPKLLQEYMQTLLSFYVVHCQNNESYYAFVLYVT